MKDLKNYACYGQMSIFDYLTDAKDKNTFAIQTLKIVESSETQDPQQLEQTQRELAKPNFDVVKAFAAKGSFFQNGKQRIRDFFLANIDPAKRITFLKKEYGQGGFGPGVRPPYTIHSADYSPKGCIVWWVNGRGDNIETIIPWKSMEKKISELISEGNY